MEQLQILKNTIIDIHKIYIEFSENFDKNFEYEKKNMKKYRVAETEHNYIFWELIKLYLNTLSIQDDLQDFMFENTYIDGRVRIKNIDSLREKMVHYINKGGVFYVNGCVNDLFGIRIFLNDLHGNYAKINDLLENLKKVKIISRYYLRNDRNYCGLHCYFQDKNYHFAWELQLWDYEDIQNNINEHARHEAEKRGGISE